jgi:hypothetical protein
MMQLANLHHAQSEANGDVNVVKPQGLHANVPARAHDEPGPWDSSDSSSVYN